MAGNNSKRRGEDSFGNRQVVTRLNIPKEGGDAQVKGLLIGYVEIGGKLYRLQVSGTSNPKSNTHAGWCSVTLMPPQGRNGLGGRNGRDYRRGL